MKKNKKYLLMIFNIVIIMLLTTFAWMITDPSEGEVIMYENRFVIPDSNVNVDLYVLKNNVYVLQSQNMSEQLVETNLMQPGAIQRYRFDITNIQDVVQAIKIVFTGITGDIEVLDDYITINCTNPYVFSKKLSEVLEYDEVNQYYYFDFIDSQNIPSHETISIYWNIAVSQQAGNEIENLNIAIDKIMFIKP